jgi:SAM-dependent methyltransferase
VIDLEWSEKLGRGVIDCHFDPVSRTIAAGDLDGSVTLLGSNGTIIDQRHIGMPVWGIAQAQIDGQLQIAVAGADKTKSAGRGHLFVDFELSAEFEAEGELWDCAFLPSGVCYSSWASKLYFTDRAGELTSSLPTPGTPYGLLVEGSEISVVLNGTGIGRLGLDDPDERRLAVSERLPDVCYKLARAGDQIVCGSKGNAVRFASALGQSRVVGEGEVCAVAAAGHYLLAGDLEGSLALFHLGVYERPLASFTLPGGIWSIEIDQQAGLAYVACGDGRLYCLYMELAELADQEISEARAAISSPLDSERLRTLAGTPAAVEMALGMIEEEWERWSAADIEAVARLARAWKEDRESDRLLYVLGMAELERKKSDESILLFQAIDQHSTYKVKSLLPLGRALAMNGSLGAAVRILRLGLPSVPEDQQAGYLFEIGKLHERRGDSEHALAVYESLSSLDHGYPGLRERLDALRNRESPQVSAPAELSGDLIREEERSSPGLSARRSDNYDAVSYLLYEYGAPDDEAKKHMEAELMATVIADLPNGGRSLDVGCATGRWPEWFARKGFEAHGYDISRESIDICSRRAEQLPELGLSFELYDICNGARLRDHFDVITCMMGTFNHVPPDSRDAFLSGIHDSLAEGGRFVVSVWNSSSPFCEYLGLDLQVAKEALRRNSLEQEAVLNLLRSSGFEIEKITPFCFLPNECYRVWDDEFQEGIPGMLQIEQFLRDNLTFGSRSQMHFISALAGGAP